jgi:hypothetical protein
VVDADPTTVLGEVVRMTSRDVPIMVALMAVRRLPTLLSGSGSLRPDRRPIVEQLERSGFVRLSETDDELVLGVVGRFWRPAGDLRRVPAESFAEFAQPGWAKGVIKFRVTPAGDRTLLSTETRVLATDAAARRRFRCYWRLIYPGSAVIRVAWLRAIRRRSIGSSAWPPSKASGAWRSRRRSTAATR